MGRNGWKANGTWMSRLAKPCLIRKQSAPDLLGKFKHCSFLFVVLDMCVHVSFILKKNNVSGRKYGCRKRSEMKLCDKRFLLRLCIDDKMSEGWASTKKNTFYAFLEITIESFMCIIYCYSTSIRSHLYTKDDPQLQLLARKLGEAEKVTRGRCNDKHKRTSNAVVKWQGNFFGLRDIGTHEGEMV